MDDLVMDNLANMDIEPFGGVYKNERVLVTGHTGFKGSWLSSWLTQLGAHVYGYSKGVPTDPSLFEAAGLSSVLDHTIGDVRDLESVSAVLQRVRPRFVFHLAAQPIVSLSYADPLETMSTNVMGTSVVLQALRQVDWPCAVVIITSDKCYDNVEWPWGYRETDALGGKDIYSGSKGGAELAFRSFFHSFFKKPDLPVRLSVARAGNVIGGGDWAKDRIVADCVRAWIAGQKVQIRSPAATRPWQHVLEPLSGYLVLGQALCGNAAENGEAYNFGPRAEQSRTVVELLSDLARIWGFASSDEAYEITANIPFHEAGLLKLNCDKALLRLRWEPTLMYGECMELTGGWYRKVVCDKEDARAVTYDHIRRYEQLAAERGLRWRMGAKR